ncbi:hypothetical protein [Shewanella marina]|uniref:hypothetical protein n=1 Tax=Shewanella marina TaxID=487319 RepID=UPI00047002D1|nr:hypothetical protein [Shewanella marina]
MNIFEMMRTGELSPMLFAFGIQAIALGTLCFLLARSKNRNYKLAILVGAIPILNYLSVLYYIGVPILERTSPESGNDS